MPDDSKNAGELGPVPEAPSAQSVPAPSINTWSRLKEHKVAQWTLAYAAAALTLLEGAKLISDAYDWPHQIVRVATTLLILGLPLVVTLAWFHGHRALKRASGAELTVIATLLVVAGGVLWHFARTSHESETPHVNSTRPPVAAFSPPPHSIAVLPFVNMSGDKEQEYFSEGLTEELLNSLARLDELQVAARTSSFSFQGEHPDITTVAHKLNVGAVLEGSVRRSGHTVRITTQLVNGVTGFHMWSETYDRDLKDVLKLQTEIANAVASGLKVTLLGDVAAKVELGGTRNPAAFDAYLRGKQVYNNNHNNKDSQSSIADYSEAIRLDPSYALAFAGRSLAFTLLANPQPGPAARENFDRAQQDALKAIALAPDLGEGHLALGDYFKNGALNFAGAKKEYERALVLAPGNAQIVLLYGLFTVEMGRTDAGLAAVRRAIVLDPLNHYTRFYLGYASHWARQYGQAIAAYQDSLALDPDDPYGYAFRGLAYYAQGDLQRARESCASRPDNPFSQQCLAVTYDKLGRHTDAEDALSKLRATAGVAFAYQQATIYAQWGNTARALEWLEKALQLRDSGLVDLKVDPFLDPLRNEPRFQAIEKALKFPD
jgi:serine/threonine-protein kinase